MVACCNLDLPHLVFSPEPAPIHRRIEAPEQFNRDTRRPVLDRAWLSVNPVGMLWPEMDAALVALGEEPRSA
jgi:hypothetical protein